MDINEIAGEVVELQGMMAKLQQSFADIFYKLDRKSRNLFAQRLVITARRANEELATANCHIESMGWIVQQLQKEANTEAVASGLTSDSS